MDTLVQRLSHAADAALGASRARAFDGAVNSFTSALQTIPDYPAAELSNEAFARVNSLAEQLIAEIEHRIGEDGIDDTRRTTLGERVYDIRRALEEEFNWRRHYLRS